MRRALATLTAGPFFLFFLLAPFLHVHEGKEHEHGTQSHHRHATTVHAHVVLPVLEQQNSTSAFDLSHEQHKGTAFHFCPTTQDVFHLAVAFPEEEMMLGDSPAASDRLARAESPRAHSPPALDFLSPRSPPA